MEYYSGQWSAGPPVFKQYNHGFDQNHSGFKNNNGSHGLVHVDTDDLKYLNKNKLSSNHPLGFNDVISFPNPANIPGEVSTDDFDIVGTNDQVVFLCDKKTPSYTCNNNVLNPQLNPVYKDETKTPSQPCTNYSLNPPLNPTYTCETKVPSQTCNYNPLNPTYTFENKAPSEHCNNYQLNPTYAFEIKTTSKYWNNYQSNPTYAFETKAPSEYCNNYQLNPTYAFETKAPVPSQPCNNYALNPTYTYETMPPSQPCNNYLLNPQLNSTYTYETKAPSQPCTNYSLNPTYTYKTKAPSQPCNYPLNPYTCETKAPSQPCNFHPLNPTYTFETKDPTMSCNPLNPPINPIYTFENKTPSQPCNNYPLNSPLNRTYMFETKAPSFDPGYLFETKASLFDQGPDEQSFLDSIADERAQYDVSDEVDSNSTLENPSPHIFPMHTNPKKNMPPLCPYIQLDDADSCVTENAQGLEQQCRKRTRKPSKSKAKTCTDEVLKVVSSAELEADEWVWEKYGRKKLASTLHRSYYKCADETCEAKRHVDKSYSDPNTYIVSYFGHHSHSPSTYTSPIREKEGMLRSRKRKSAGATDHHCHFAYD